MNSKAIIGICIPTYNRSMILKENLINIIKNVEKENVPIYISDNCSEDDTAKIVSEMKQIYPHIFYRKNDRNLGVDRNFQAVLKMCRERYAWLLGDDDTLDSDISPILDVLNISNPDVLVLGRNENIKDGVYVNKNTIFNDMTLEMTWMSGQIISKKVIDQADFQRYYDTEFLHTGIILDYLGKSEHIRFMYSYNEYVKCLRPEYVAYSNRILEIYAKGWTELIVRLPGFSFEDKLKHCKYRTKKTGMLNNRILLSLRAQGYLDYKKLREYRHYIALYNKAPYSLLFFISIFPKRISAILRRLYKIYLKHK